MYVYTYEGRATYCTQCNKKDRDIGETSRCREKLKIQGAKEEKQHQTCRYCHLM